MVRHGFPVDLEISSAVFIRGIAAPIPSRQAAP
jgi:hypothetical protein